MTAHRRVYDSVMPPAGWLPRTGISSGTLRSAVEYGLALPLPFTETLYVDLPTNNAFGTGHRYAIIRYDGNGLVWKCVEDMQLLFSLHSFELILF